LPANEGINMIMKNKTILITGGATGIGLATDVTMSCRPHWRDYMDSLAAWNALTTQNQS
jgi:hypothetical protein